MDVEVADELIIDEQDSIYDTIVNVDDSVASDALVDDSFSSVFDASPSKVILPPPVSMSTPKTPKQRKTMGVPKVVNRLPCDQCSLTYANERTLATHKRMHAMKSKC